MERELMSSRHQLDGLAPWTWGLANGEVRRLAALPLARWLKVDSGRLWLTPASSDGRRDDDVWLRAGEVVALPAGSEWLVEGWPCARLSVLEQAPAAPPVSAREASWAGWWRGVVRRWRQRPRAVSVLHA